MSSYNGIDVYSCPYCKAKASRLHQSSGNSFGAARRSDTYVYARMMPRPVAVAKCKRCGKYYSPMEVRPRWVEDGLKRLLRCGDRRCYRILSLLEESSPKRRPALPEFGLQDEEVRGFNEISAALDQFRAERKDLSRLELPLRLRMLWASNESNNKVGGVSADDADRNRRALLSLPGISGYLRVELFRELGEYSLAIYAARNMSEGDKWFDALKKIIPAIKEGKKEVFWLTRPNFKITLPFGRPRSFVFVPSFVTFGG